MKKIKNICLVLDSLQRKNLSVKEIENITKRYTISLILVDIQMDSKIRNTKNIHKPYKSFLNSTFFQLKEIASGNFFKLVHIEEYMAARIFKKDRKILRKLQIYNQRVDLLKKIPVLKNAEIVYFDSKPINNGLRYDFPDDIIQIVNQTCDVVVLEGYNKILTGNVLHATKFGVLSGHGADIRKYRGRPQGFFQWINDEKIIGSTIQIITNDLDGGYLLVCDHADITKARSWFEVKLILLELRIDLITRALNMIQNENFKPEIPQTGILTRTKDANKISYVLKCLKKNITRRYFRR